MLIVILVIVAQGCAWGWFINHVSLLALKLYCEKKGIPLIEAELEECFRETVRKVLLGKT